MHFLRKKDMPVICYLLAGEKGPSCTSIDQLPSTKLLHLRLLPKNGVGDLDEEFANTDDIIGNSEHDTEIPASSKRIPLSTKGGRLSLKRPRVDVICSIPSVKDISLSKMFKAGTT